MRSIADSASLALLAAAALILAACTPDPYQIQKEVLTMEPNALAAANERAQSDLNCGAIKTNVLSSDSSEMGSAYDLNRVLYKVQATGCGMRTTYSVACTKSVCSALSDGSSIEKIKQ